MAYSITIDTNLNVARISQQVDTAVNQFSRFEQRVKTSSKEVGKSVNAISLDIAIDGINQFAEGGENAASVLDLVQENIGNLRNNINPLVGSLAGVAASVLTLAKVGADAGDSFNDMADRTGLSVEELAGLSLATKLADTNLESLALSLNKLSVNIANNREEFSQLGISATDPLEALIQLADVFSSIDDVQERAALGQKALGRSYAELAPLLLGGGDALREQIQLGKEYVGITSEDAKRAAAFNDALDTLTFRMKALAGVGGTVVLTVFEQIGQRLDQLSTKTDTWLDKFNNLVTAIAEQANKGLGVNLETFTSVTPEAGKLAQQIVEQQIKVNILKNESGAFKLLDDLAGIDITVEQRKLDVLQKQYEQELQTYIDKKNAPAAPVNKAANTINVRGLAKQAEQKYSLPPNLVQALINVESNGIQKSVSEKGAVGLLQVLPSAHPELDSARLRTDAAYNVDKGSEYLAKLFQIFNGELPKVIAAYNAGENAVKKSLKTTGGLPNIPENRNFVDKVFKELDNLSGGNSNQYDSLLSQFNATVKSMQDALKIDIESQIDVAQKTTVLANNAKIVQLKTLKEEGKVDIKNYYDALTQYQQAIIAANITAVQAKQREADRQYQVAVNTAKPEELPTINANFRVQKNNLQTQLQELQQQFSEVPQALDINRKKELAELKSVEDQVRIKIANLRNEVANDPLALKVKIEVDQEETLRKLREGGLASLADEYVKTLTVTEQAKILEDQITEIQNRTQIRETQINILQQTGSITQFTAQQRLKQLYQEQADEIDNLAQQLDNLGSNSGLDDLTNKALEAKNAAAQLRITVPALKNQLVDAGQSAAINGLAGAMVNLTNQTQTAGQAFVGFALNVVQAIQNIAAQRAAQEIFGYLFTAAGGYFGGSESAGTPSTTGVGSFFSPGGANFASGKYAEGGLIKGPGSGTSDSINAMAPVGSYIVKANAVNAIGANRLDHALNDISSVATNASGKYAEGGLIKGPGSGTSDSINAMAPVGSYIIKANAVNAIGANRLDHALNDISSVATNHANETLVPVKVSNGEYFAKPSLVKKLGVGFFETINRFADFKHSSVLKGKPPAILQKAFAQGGFVGSATSQPNITPSQQTISVSVPVTINQGQDAAGSGKLSANVAKSLGDDLNAVVDSRVRDHLRPGGLLYKELKS